MSKIRTVKTYVTTDHVSFLDLADAEAHQRAEDDGRAFLRTMGARPTEHLTYIRRSPAWVANVRSACRGYLLARSKQPGDAWQRAADDVGRGARESLAFSFLEGAVLPKSWGEILFRAMNTDDSGCEHDQPYSRAHPGECKVGTP